MEKGSGDVSSNMPITGVILYDNGYAVFERQTLVHGHGQIDLYFPKSLMKDVLESLQFLGDAGPNVGNIAYESTKPKASIHFSEGSPFVSLLQSLVGTQISLKLKQNDEIVEGRILGIEDVLPDTSEREVPHVSLYLPGGQLGMYPLSSVASVNLSEEQTRRDISFSLDLTKNENKDDMQKLCVFYSNVEPQKKLIARYGFQVSEWKSSYRMTHANEKPSCLMLHGLAIIENSLWEDWEDVNVTLVVGTPALQSTNELKDEGIWRIVVKGLDGSTINVRANPKDSVLALKAKIGKKKGTSPFSFKLIFCGKAVEDGRQLSDYTIADGAVLHMSKVESRGTQSQGTTVQAQFVMAAQDNLSFYPIPVHVTAQRKQKAIVTMLHAQLEGQHVVLYDETVRKGNPLSAVLFENTTGRTLEGGSLILSTAETFLGQSNLPTLSPGDESPPIPFAVELGCEVVKSNDSTYLKPHRVEIVNGEINFFRIHRETTFYRIQNKSDKKLDFLLNHIFLEDYDLVQNPNIEEEEPVDITDRFYQFRFHVEPRCEKKTFIVREEITDRKRHSVRSLDEDEFNRWVNRKHFDAATEQAIRKTFMLRKQVSSTEREIYEKEGEIREINRAQDHIRENISALEHHAKQAAKYIASLEEEEEELKAAQDFVKRNKAAKKSVEKTLSDIIAEVQYTCDLKVAPEGK